MAKVHYADVFGDIAALCLSAKTAYYGKDKKIENLKNV